MAALNWSKGDKFTCIRIQGQQPEYSHVLAHALHGDLFRSFPDSYILFNGHQQCIVLNLTRHPTTLPRIQHMLAPLCRDYCLYAGISSPVQGSHQLHLAFHETDVALNQAFRLQSDRWIIPFSDCALDYIFSSLHSPLQSAHIAAPELQLLMEHDREKGTQYFETLRTYLLQERDIPRTSEKLIIHRTTLQSREAPISPAPLPRGQAPHQKLCVRFASKERSPRRDPKKQPSADGRWHPSRPSPSWNSKDRRNPSSAPQDRCQTPPRF